MSKNYISNGQLRPCHQYFIGISTNPTSIKSAFIKPLQHSPEVYTSAMRDILKKIVQENFRGSIIKYGENYLRFEIKTMFSFDELEILLVFDKYQVHFRSWARNKVWDFGRNRRRVEKIKKLLKKQLPKPLLPTTI